MKAFYLVIQILFSVSGSIAFAGGWSGNGGSTALDSNNIWFIGKEPIPYCVIAATGPFTEAAVHQMIKRSASKWKNFFERYGMLGHEFGVHANAFPDSLPRTLSLDFVPAQNCTDVVQFCSPANSDSDRCSEALSDKILFLVGKPNSIITSYLQVNGSADGVALRTDYNNKTFRTGGIVWINQRTQANWSGYAHMMIHEMGHVFGMKHDSCWAMATNVSQLVNNWLGISSLEKIETPNWPYSYLPNDRLLFTDRLSDPSTSSTPSGYYPNAQMLTPDLLSVLEFLPENYFQVRAQMRAVALTLVQVTLELEEYPSGKIHQMTGSLSEAGFDVTALVPQLYTNWVSGFSSKTYFDTESLMEGWVSGDLRGILDWNGKKVSVTLQRQKGLKLGLYIPGSNDWLILQTAQVGTKKNNIGLRDFN